jgi:hypothetical protein
MDEMNAFQVYLNDNKDKIKIIDIKDKIAKFNEFVIKIQRENDLKRQKSWESASKLYIK